MLPCSGYLARSDGSGAGTKEAVEQLDRPPGKNITDTMMTNP
jgi:hypothetical protein